MTNTMGRKFKDPANEAEYLRLQCDELRGRCFEYMDKDGVKRILTPDERALVLNKKPVYNFEQTLAMYIDLCARDSTSGNNINSESLQSEILLLKDERMQLQKCLGKLVAVFDPIPEMNEQEARELMSQPHSQSISNIVMEFEEAHGL